jgi:hypothetical protein
LTKQSLYRETPQLRHPRPQHAAGRLHRAVGTTGPANAEDRRTVDLGQHDTYTPDGVDIIVVYDEIDEDTVYLVTAYEVAER